MKKQVISTKNTSSVECYAGDCGNVNLRFFYCKLYDELFIFTLKTVNLTVFYSEIT